MENLKLKLKQQSINWDDKCINTFSVYSSNFVTMVYGPIAAFLVEMFAKIRYTSMSLPYHVGNGILRITAAFYLLVINGKDAGDPEFYLEGLWYPIIIASVCFVVGMVYIKNKDEKNTHI
jgi:hypothetical protein